MISFVLSYYNQPRALKWQISLWRTWPREVLEKSEIILIDDGSMREPALPVVARYGHPANFSLYRVMMDIPWNQNGAHNLGAWQAAGDWLMMLDIDHGFTADNAAAVLRLQHHKPPAPWYTFPRRYHGKMIRFAPNIYLMRRRSYWQIGGNDEDLAGEYLQDRLFRQVAERELGKSMLVPAVTVDVLNAPTPGLVRQSPRNEELIRRKLAGELPISRDVIRFPWERLI